jgi:hypothetical protein
MAKTKTKMKIFTIADYQKEEQWLADQHAEGWKLIKIIIPVFYVFEQTTPEKMIYQLEFKETEVTEDYIKMFEDYGWQYFGSYVGWNYFRKPESEIENESDKEIFSDVESKVEMIDKVFKSRMLPLLIIFFAAFLPQVSELDKEVFKTSDVLFAIIYLILFGLYVFLMIYCGVKLIKMKKDLEK